MPVILYLLIGFIIFYFMYQKYMPILKQRKQEGSDYDPYAYYKEFWYMIIPSLIWWLAIPMYIIWKLLDKVNNDIINKPKKEE